MGIYNKSAISIGPSWDVTLAAGVVSDAMRIDIAAEAYGSAAQAGTTLATLNVTLKGINVLSRPIVMPGVLTPEGNDSTANLAVSLLLIRASDTGFACRGIETVAGKPVAFIPTISIPNGVTWKNQQNFRVELVPAAGATAGLTTVGASW
jgi:hypothetical protein